MVSKLFSFCILIALGWMMAPAAQAGAFSFSFQNPALVEGAPLTKQEEFKGFGCDGANLSPELLWENVPAGTKSIALTVYDPDAPTGSGWWHWTLFNLPPEENGIPAGIQPHDARLPSQAVQGRNDYGLSGFGGACPPKGDKPHRYEFTLWALDVPALPLKAEAPGAQVGFFVRQHALAQKTITLLYQR